jgi:group I intron endonuclease
MIVYCVTNTVNGKYYIGKTVDTVDARWSDHKYLARSTGRQYIHKAIRKHGEDSFVLGLLADCSSERQALDLEKLWILVTKAYDPAFGYNLTMGGEGVTPNDETRKRLSAAQKRRVSWPKLSEETIAKIVAKNTGQKRSNATRARMSLAQKGKTITEEHRLAIKAGSRHLPTIPKGTVVRTDAPNDEIARLYGDGLSCRKIAEIFRISPGTIWSRLHHMGVVLRPVGFPPQLSDGLISV